MHGVRSRQLILEATSSSTPRNPHAVHLRCQYSHDVHIWRTLAYVQVSPSLQLCTSKSDGVVASLGLITYSTIEDTLVYVGELLDLQRW